MFRVLDYLSEGGGVRLMNATAMAAHKAKEYSVALSLFLIGDKGHRLRDITFWACNARCFEQAVQGPQFHK